MGKKLIAKYEARQKKKVPPAVKAFVAKAIDKAQEDKFVEETLATNFGSISGGGTVWNEKDVSSIAQGLTSSTRVGRRIKIKSLEINGVLAGAQTGTTADDNYNVVRSVIALYQGSSGSLGGALNIDQSFRKNTGGGQNLVKKYMDHYTTLQVQTARNEVLTTGYGTTVKKFHFYKKFKNLYIDFANDTISFPNKRLVISMIGDSNVAPNPGFVRGYWRMTFEDA